MACGLPVACSKYNGCWPELIQPEHNGWIFDPRNAVEVAKLLADVERNKNRLPAMGEHSEQIIQQYSPRSAAHAIFQACRSALHHA